MKFKLTDYLYPLEIFRLFRNLQKSQYYAYEQLVDFQNKQLEGLLNHAYNHVPYYREVFDRIGLKPNDIQTVNDLVHVPVLTKEILRERFNDLKADNAYLFKPYINKTSGSTGTPLQFLQDKNVSIARFAFFWRAWHMAGYKPYMKWVQVDGMYVTQSGELWNYSRVLNSLQINAYSINFGNCQKVIDKVNSFKPRILRGYPNAIYTLAQFIEINGIPLKFNLKSVITYSENLLPFQRELIQKVFCCKVYDIYSMWEGVCLITECEHQRYHQHMELSIMEILNEGNQSVEVGIQGEVTATSFYNFSMPFIRYKTGDLAKRSNEKCNCGRNLIIVDEIIGRKRDALFDTKGFLVPFQGFLMGTLSDYEKMKGLIQSQIVQNNLNEVEVTVVLKNPEVFSNVCHEIENSIKARLGNEMKVKFFVSDEIKKEPNGKMRFVVNKLIDSEGNPINNTIN